MACEFAQFTSGELLAHFEVDPSTGLTAQRVEARRRLAPDALSRELGELFPPLLSLLLISALLQYGAAGTNPETTVAVAFVAVTLVWKAVRRRLHRRELRRWRERSAPKLETLRDGQWGTVPLGDLHQGDLVRLQPGDTVSVESRLTRANHLQITRAGSTLKRFPGAVSDSEPTRAQLTANLFPGDVIVSGTGTALVLKRAESSQGESSLLCSLIQTAAKHRRKSLIGSVALALLVCLFRSQADLATLAEVALLAVATIYAATTQDLKSRLSQAHLVSARRLNRQSTHFPEAESLENLAGVNTVIAKLNGTLTEGSARIAQLAIDQDLYQLSGADSLPDSPAVLTLLECAVLSCPAQPEVQAALAQYCSEEVLQSQPLLDERPYCPTRDRKSVLRESGPEQECLYCSGSLDSLLEHSNGLLRGDGASVALTEQDRLHLHETQQRLARMGYRVLAVARRERPPSDPMEWETGLELLGLLALDQPIRADAQEGVKSFQKAGFRLMVRSRDHLERVRMLTQAAGLDESQILVGLSSPEFAAKVIRLKNDRGPLALSVDLAQDADLLGENCVGLFGPTAPLRPTRGVSLDEATPIHLLKLLRESRNYVSRCRALTGFLLSGNLALLLVLLTCTLLKRGEVALSVGQILFGTLFVDLIFGELLLRSRAVVQSSTSSGWPILMVLSGALTAAASTAFLFLEGAVMLVAVFYGLRMASVLNFVESPFRQPKLLLGLAAGLSSGLWFCSGHGLELSNQSPLLLGLLTAQLLPCQGLRWWQRRQGKA